MGSNMEIQEKEEKLLYQKLTSEEFMADRREAIRFVKEFLWDWNLKEQIQQKRMPLKAVEGRIKTPESIIEKLRKKGYMISLKGVEQLHDLAGVRAVCSYLDDVYRLKEYIVTSKKVQVLSQKDYIALPKKSGYQSLHLLLKTRTGLVELQIRTVAMDYWSNLEHPVIYKKGIYADEKVGRELIRYARFLREVDGMLVALRMEREKRVR